MILVTGAGGVLGSALVAHLREGERKFAVLESAHVDLRDADATRRAVEAVRPTIVYHLAARVHGLGGNTRFPAEMFTDNIHINTNVIEAAHQAGCEKIVAVSTVAIYSSDAPRPTGEEAIWLGPPHRSERAYGHAKRAMLAQLEAFRAQHGLAYAYPILTNIYGPHDRFDIDNGHVVPSLVAKFHRAAIEGGRVEVWGTGVAERDFIMARDAARALVLIGDECEGPINVATGGTASIRNIVKTLAEVSGVTDVCWDATKPDGQLERLYDVTRLRALGFEPLVPLREGLRETYEWYASHFPNVRR